MTILNEKALARLTHTDEHLNGDSFQPERILSLNNRISANEDNASSCILRLSSFATAKGISSWFHTENLAELKNWFYVHSKLAFILTQPPFNQTAGTMANENKALHGMFFLVSDNLSLIRWYSNYDQAFGEKYVNNTGRYDYWTKQFFVGLRGEWDVLGDRCERLLANPPNGSREKKFIIDHQFYLALAKGDVARMEAVINILVTNKYIARRDALEGGYTAGLICTPAILYSKLAWYHGYEVNIDSPYIPKEWLPISPLDSYTDPYDFMKSYA
ncbi:immunity 49 family protein [Undibacterium sp. CY18W]|uniref:Immunity 49 family protein n=1 Tax=Undibacterium hunanense TaxID=2762292 RepID=A0ABR6ZXB6_9BURK|nr:Imm49 family immunity protein [Undibacterium hunanense]MBC3920309.1 immunity 49 family protein [Undibacterium hunanense]